MSIFLPVLFISLLSVTIFLFFAFFPIRVVWFYQSNNYRPAKKTSTGSKSPPITHYDFSRDYKSYGKAEDFDDYDDAEL